MTDTSKLSYTELRLVGISLSILSLGIALAWLGYFWVTTDKTGDEVQQKSATASGSIR
jgi:hypothetical protein